MTGSIIKRAEGSYSIKLELGKDPATGKRKQKWITVKGNKRDAERELAKHVNDINTGGFVSPAKMTVADFLDKWYSTHVEANVPGGTTRQRYRQIMDLHLKPVLGAVPLTKLSPLHIQEAYANWLKGGRLDGRPGGLSTQTVLHHHRVLSEALDKAVRWQLLAKNPAVSVEPPKVVRKEVPVLTEIDTVWLVEAAEGSRVQLPIMIASTLGLRRGEVLALRWQDFDRTTMTVHVRQAVEETKAGIRMKESKGKRSRRIAVPPVLAEYLLSQEEQQAVAKQTLGAEYDRAADLICCQPNGQLWKPSAFTSAYRALLRRRSLKGTNYHGLRHTHASQLISAGVDINQVSGRLGHAKAGFTLNTYVHLMPGKDQEAARRTDVLLRKAFEEAKKRPVV